VPIEIWNTKKHQRWASSAVEVWSCKRKGFMGKQQLNVFTAGREIKRENRVGILANGIKRT